MFFGMLPESSLKRQLRWKLIGELLNFGYLQLQNVVNQLQFLVNMISLWFWINPEHIVRYLSRSFAGKRNSNREFDLLVARHQKL